MKALSTTPFLLLFACQSPHVHDSGTTDSGRCGDVQTDQNNCGRCGNVCSAVAPSTTECVMGRCLTTLVSQDRVPGIVVTTGEIYWLNSVRAADGGSTTALWKTGLEGGVPTTILSGGCDLGENRNGPIAVDATSFYCAVGYGEDAYVAKMPLDGGSELQLVVEDNWLGICELAVDGSYVYWSTCYKDSYIVRARLSGAVKPTRVAWSQRVCPSNLVLRDASLYWLGDGLASDGYQTTSLMKISTTDDGAQPIPLLDWSASWGRFAVGATAIYWTDPDQGSVMAAPLDGGASPAAVATGLDSPRDVAVDASHLYWASYDGGQVMRLSLDDGALTILASGQSRPHGIVLDATSVYWISSDGGQDTVVKATPK
jgi:hypothetical protein